MNEDFISQFINGDERQTVGQELTYDVVANAVRTMKMQARALRAPLSLPPMHSSDPMLAWLREQKAQN